jgi:hypothetical protein
MIAALIGNMITICIGIAIVWGWVAFIAEAIARRTGKTRRVPYPDEGLWALFGKDLLDLGLFGGTPGQKQRPQRSMRWHLPRGRRFHALQ